MTACELDPTMHSVAEEVLEANGFLKPSPDNDRIPIRLLKTHSNDIVVAPHDHRVSHVTPAAADDSPSQCVVNDGFDLIVTETLDCGIFGEGIVSTLQGAWKNLIRQDNFDGSSDDARWVE